MKTNYTQFECDNCGEKLIKHAKTGFPYEKGWVYLHKLEGKVGNTSKDNKDDLNIIHHSKYDLHFCKIKCEIDFINTILTNSRNTQSLPEMETGER